MPMNWKEAVWDALRRMNAAAPDQPITRARIIATELPRIIEATGSTGATPDMTLSRVLQELRDDGVLIFDGKGRYRLTAKAAPLPLASAIATEALALVDARRGQSGFRKALDARWDGRCPLTGIKERDLLRASHIVGWSECEDESERLNPENGLLLSALWDAAFDKKLVTFADDGQAIGCKPLSPPTLTMLKAGGRDRIKGLTPGNRERLKLHRAACDYT